MLLDDSLVTTREVTDWQGLHLFHFDLSSCSQKVRILFNELGIGFEAHPINLMRDEQRSEWYLGINPRGEVPVLVHDGAVHTESNDIIQYIDLHFAQPGRSFLPSSDSERQDMQDLMDLENELHQDLRTLTFTYLAPDVKNRVSNANDDLNFIGRFNSALETLDQRLQSRPFLLGDRLTLLDISWFITLYRLHLAGYPLEDHPKLANYFDRIKARPTFAKEVAAGPLNLRLATAIYRRLNRVFGRSLASDYLRWQRKHATTN